MRLRGIEGEEESGIASGKANARKDWGKLAVAVDICDIECYNENKLHLV